MFLQQGSMYAAVVAMTALAGLALASNGGAAGGAQKAAAPDVIYYNGNLITMDAAHPRATALAMRGDKIVGVGDDAAVLKLAVASTRRVDLHGRFGMPAFNDAHTHIASAGANKLKLDLTGTRSLAEFQARIKAYAEKTPAGEWILGSQWDQTEWPGQRFPTAKDLDAVTGDHPAWLERMDGHGAVANSKAMQIAGVNRTTAVPAGGRMGKDAAGNPDGLFFEDAKALITSKLPPISAASRRRALELALQDALAHGVTSVQDYSTWNDFLTLEQMERDGGLHVSVYEWITFNDPVEQLKQKRAHHDAGDPLLHTGMLKGFMDGSLGSRTAALLAPYADDPGNSGLPQYDQAKLNAMAVERAKAGFQLGFHAIGDRAARMALDAFQAAENADPGAKAQRNRIEHLQVLAPSDVARMKQLNVIASVQPCHLLDDGRWAEARLGPERAKSSYLLKSFLNEGVTLAFGTDYPVEAITPFANLYAATTRSAVDGSWTYQPQEKLSMQEAIYAYTMGSAYAEFAEKDKGSLTPGKRADFIVLDRDLMTAASKAVLETKVLLTVAGGKEVYKGE